MAKSLRSQNGIALLLFLFVVIVIGATYFITTMNSASPRSAQESRTQFALEQAKEALLGDAATYKGANYLPGRLRCPELLTLTSPIEGQAQSNCSTTGSRLGRFPWSSLRMDKLVDSYGEPLWYVVSPGFSAAPINSATLGQLMVDNRSNAAVALIIAPGPPLPGQNRGTPSASAPPQPGDYLESNVAGGSAFVTTGGTDNYNDKVLVITQADLFRAVTPRVLAEVRGLDDQAPNLPLYGLRGYFNTNGQFPPNGTLLGTLSYDASTLGWLTTNNWFSVITYTRISSSNAKISIGSTTMSVFPCTSLPCH